MGKLYGIGVGPGDPELLTLKGCRIINEADVIFCPEKESGAGSFAFDIIRENFHNENAELVSLVYPMHYHGERLREMWKENAAHIESCLAGGRTGAFITLGDPTVYSTFMYTLHYIDQSKVEVEVVPGVTSFCAVASALKLPLVEWEESLAVIPVRRNSSEILSRALAENDNIVLMKPASSQAEIVRAIKENHLENHFVLTSKAGTPEEHVVTELAELEANPIPYLSTMIIKKKGI